MNAVHSADAYDTRWELRLNYPGVRFQGLSSDFIDISRKFFWKFLCELVADCLVQLGQKNRASLRTSADVVEALPGVKRSGSAEVLGVNLKV